MRYLLFLFIADALFAQVAGKPTFEVASIKRSASTTGPVGPVGIRFPPGGRIVATRMSVKTLILVAWNTEWLHVLGGPSWIETEAYDIEAKADGSLSQAERRVMLQSLLEERFHLKLHRETRELPIYALLVAKPGTQLGPGLLPAREGACAKIDPAKPLSSEVTAFCGSFHMTQKILDGQPLSVNQLQGFSVSLNALSRTLAGPLQRDVTDETHLSGTFDVTLEFANSAGASTQTPDVTAPSIFTALQEQLGLKLESRKGPVEIYLVDHAEHPTEN